MAGIKSEITLTTSKSKVHRWSLTQDTYGAALPSAHLSDKTMHVHGTFAGATVSLYGSNNPADEGVEPNSGSDTWVLMKDNLDNNIVKTLEGGDILIENYHFIAPKLAGGDGTTDVKISICAKGE